MFLIQLSVVLADKIDTTILGFALDPTRARPNAVYDVVSKPFVADPPDGLDARLPGDAGGREPGGGARRRGGWSGSSTTARGCTSACSCRWRCWPGSTPGRSCRSGSATGSATTPADGPAAAALPGGDDPAGDLGARRRWPSAWARSRSIALSALVGSLVNLPISYVPDGPAGRSSGVIWGTVLTTLFSNLLVPGDLRLPRPGDPAGDVPGPDPERPAGRGRRAGRRRPGSARPDPARPRGLGRSWPDRSPCWPT